MAKSKKVPAKSAKSGSAKPAKSAKGGASKAGKKPAAKPVAKKATKPVAKKAAKPAAKKAAKPVVKKPVPKAKPAPPKKTSKPAAAPKKAAPAKKAPAKAPVPVKKSASGGVVVKNPIVSMKKNEPKTPAVTKAAEKPANTTPEDNRSRYSDEELVEFRTLINKKLDEASRDYELLKATLSHKDDHGTDDTSPTFKLLEDGSDVLSKEETAHLAARQEKYIQNLKNALIRIQNKTYGICRVTGKLIPKERLRSVPHATLSIDAKLGQYK